MPGTHLISSTCGVVFPSGQHSPSRQCSPTTISKTHRKSIIEDNASGSSAKQAQCCLHFSKTWIAFKAALCYVISCGHRLQMDPEVYLPWPVENPGGDVHTDHRADNPPPRGVDEKTQKDGLDDSFDYTDLKIMGVPVFSKACATIMNVEIPKDPTVPPPVPHHSKKESYARGDSYPELPPLNGSMSSAEIDGLIWEKLTELFSFHQIDELAKCTSETVFLTKSNQIMDLINSLTQDYQLEELDAECRLVRGIIRISTRKEQAHMDNIRTGGQQLKSRRHGTESGNKLAQELSSQDELDVKISDERDSDIMARNLKG